MGILTGLICVQGKCGLTFVCFMTVIIQLLVYWWSIFDQCLKISVEANYLPRACEWLLFIKKGLIKIWRPGNTVIIMRFTSCHICENAPNYFCYLFVKITNFNLIKMANKPWDYDHLRNNLESKLKFIKLWD